MCEICKQYDCIPSCPNFVERETFPVCSVCGYEMMEGERYYHIDAENVCIECLHDWAEKFSEVAEREENSFEDTE